ncbi:unnamed protein product [Xylocopa violacea]|uniref:Uncharacterized protein n=1 Tax=Xylocopa violacea TaxID=135666 RepID=A0ABP1P0P3_XYLVO
MFIDCIPWLNCLRPCATSPETPKVYGLSFKLLGLSPELGQRVHFAEGTNLRCREDTKPSDDSEERLAIGERRRFSCGGTIYKCDERA